MMYGDAAADTSNSVHLTITNWPAGIRPTQARAASCIVLDDSKASVGFLVIPTSGDCVFAVPKVTGANIHTQGGQFTASGQKGVSTFFIMYPK